MQRTERLYYTDSYLIQTHSRVTAASDDGLRIVLEQTNFYPSSGGQPHDLGTLNDIPVVDVIDDGEIITHVLAAPLCEFNVKGHVEWKRRYDHMQQHTGQHLLSAIFEELFHLATLSFHMGDEASTIELAAKDLTQHQIDSVVLRSTELARANPQISITFEDAAQAQNLRKASEREGTLRIVEIPGIDRSACGGTHVATLAEVLPLQIRDMEKVRGNFRISFLCGNRAIARSALDFHLLTRTARSLGTPLEKVESQVNLLQQRLVHAEKQKPRLETEAATRTGVDLYDATNADADGMRRVIKAEPVIDENVRTKAKAFAARPRAILFVHSGDGLLLACSPDSEVNAGALLKQALAKYGARGGGSPTLAQGGCPNGEVVLELAQLLGLDWPAK